MVPGYIQFTPKIMKLKNEINFKNAFFFRIVFIPDFRLELHFKVCLMLEIFNIDG
jgi:hypothetical protein